MLDQPNHHLYPERGGYYFLPGVPKTLLYHYQKSWIVIALRAHHFRKSMAQIQILARQLDHEWSEFRSAQFGLGTHVNALVKC
ncbi:MAG: DUF6538 domain-containing protein [Rhodospirillaceae bacterium]